MKNKEKVIKKMLNYLDEKHRNNIHEDAFKDIATVFLDLIEEYTEQLGEYIESKNNEQEQEVIEKLKWICNASMGHGKTTVLTCFLKWLVSEHKEKNRIPILLVIRERGMAEEIEKV